MFARKHKIIFFLKKSYFLKLKNYIIVFKLCFDSRIAVSVGVYPWLKVGNYAMRRRPGKKSMLENFTASVPTRVHRMRASTVVKENNPHGLLN